MVEILIDISEENFEKLKKQFFKPKRIPLPKGLPIQFYHDWPNTRIVFNNGKSVLHADNGFYDVRTLGKTWNYRPHELEELPKDFTPEVGRVYVVLDGSSNSCYDLYLGNGERAWIHGKSVHHDEKFDESTHKYVVVRKEE